MEFTQQKKVSQIFNIWLTFNLLNKKIKEQGFLILDQDKFYLGE